MPCSFGITYISVIEINVITLANETIYMMARISKRSPIHGLKGSVMSLLCINTIPIGRHYLGTNLMRVRDKRDHALFNGFLPQTFRIVSVNDVTVIMEMNDVCFRDAQFQTKDSLV